MNANTDSLKLEIWREIMRSKGEYISGSGMMAVSTQSHYTQPPDPVASAAKALNTYNALYPPAVKITYTTSAKPKRKARRR